MVSPAPACAGVSALGWIVQIRTRCRAITIPGVGVVIRAKPAIEPMSRCLADVIAWNDE